MKARDSNDILQNYLPKEKPKRRTCGQIDRVEKQIEKVKKMLETLSKEQEQADTTLEKQLTGISIKEKAVLTHYDDKLRIVLKGIDEENPIIEKSKRNQLNFEDFYQQQARLHEETENFLNKLTKKISKSKQKVQMAIRDIKSEKSPFQELPQGKVLRGQVLEEIQVCQKSFNLMMENTQSKLDKQLANLNGLQGQLMAELGTVLQARIQIMEQTLPKSKQI